MGVEVGGVHEVAADGEVTICARFRFASGGIYNWEFAHPTGPRRGRWFEIEVGGNLIVNDNALARAAACDGIALTHVPAPSLQADLDSGRLETALDRWLPAYDGLYLYYPVATRCRRSCACSSIS